MTGFDEIAAKNGDEQWEAWKKQVLEAREEIATFVASHRPGGAPKKAVGWFAGSSNLCLQVAFEDYGPDAVIRLPGPGRTTFREEKVVSGAQVIKFLQEQTTIPVPRLITWGLAKDCPRNLGPFIISELARGVDLSDVLKDPKIIQHHYLNPRIGQQTLDVIWDQIADFMLQLFQFSFSRIGALSKDPEKKSTWSVTGRPLTYAMNELASTAFYPVDQFPNDPFESARDYFRDLSKQSLIHLQTQRNLCASPEEARERYIARHLFAQQIDTYCEQDHGPFKLFCEGFRPQNILINPETHQITAVLGLEFTNAMPAQYASDPPWWLILAGPDSYLRRDHTVEEWIAAYEPRLEQFLQAMQRVERTRGSVEGEKPLSSLMREAWTTKRFWFNYAARKPFDMEIFFKKCVNEADFGIESLDSESRAGLELFIKKRMEQVAAYYEDCRRLLRYKGIYRF